MKTIERDDEVAAIEVYLSELNTGLRLEAEFYTAESADSTLDKGDDVIDYSQYGTSKGLNEENQGYPVLRLNEFELSFAGVPEKYCDLLGEAEYESLKLKSNDVLICRTNGNPKYVGKAALVMQDEDYAFASYLFRVRTNEQITPSTLVSYLNSKSGRKEIEKYAMVSNQANFSPAKFRQIAVPKFPESLESEIESMFLSAWDNLNHSKLSFKKVDNLVLDSIGLNDYQRDDRGISIRTLSDSNISHRLDSEYWEPEFDSLVPHLERDSHKLGELCVLLKSSPVYKKDGHLKVIKTKQLKNLYIDTEGCEDSSSVGVEIQNNDLLFASMGVGSLGKADLFDSSLYSGIYTTDSTIIIMREFTIITPEYLLALFGTDAYQRLIYRYIIGSSGIINVSKTHLENLPVPLISSEQQQELTELVRTGQQARKKSADLIESAKAKIDTYLK